jgi:hypothetical protein
MSAEAKAASSASACTRQHETPIDHVQATSRADAPRLRRIHPDLFLGQLLLPPIRGRFGQVRLTEIGRRRGVVLLASAQRAIEAGVETLGGVLTPWSRSPRRRL